MIYLIGLFVVIASGNLFLQHEILRKQQHATELLEKVVKALLPTKINHHDLAHHLKINDN